MAIVVLGDGELWETWETLNEHTKVCFPTPEEEDELENGCKTSNLQMKHYLIQDLVASKIAEEDIDQETSMAYADQIEKAEVLEEITEEDEIEADQGNIEFWKEAVRIYAKNASKKDLTPIALAEQCADFADRLLELKGEFD
jgi:hypothetical protein